MKLTLLFLACNPLSELFDQKQYICKKVMLKEKARLHLPGKSERQGLLHIKLSIELKAEYKFSFNHKRKGHPRFKMKKNTYHHVHKNTV